MDRENYIDQLISRLEAGTLTASEYETLINWYNSFDDSQLVLIDSPDDSVEQLKSRMHNQLMEKLTPGGRSKIRIWQRDWLKYAAAILLVSVGIWFFAVELQKRQEQEITIADIVPGGNRATLTLADGRVVELSEAYEGIVVGEQDIVYVDGSTILGDSEGLGAKMDAITTESPGLQYATLSTPLGGTYRIVLPDGTRVWLNAASTLKYPSNFDGKKRVVELDGEAYFEVTQSRTATSNQEGNSTPFIVKTAYQEVTVLGTHFNINAYDNEPFVKTTLLEGIVEVSLSSRPDKNILKPGQQSMVVDNGIEIREVDIDYAVAWKEGDFIFQDEAIESIMRKLERWYDIEVVYAGNSNPAPIGAKISRNRSLMTVLTLLESTGLVHFKLEGRRVTVMQ